MERRKPRHQRDWSCVGCYDDGVFAGPDTLLDTSLFRVHQAEALGDVLPALAAALDLHRGAIPAVAWHDFCARAVAHPLARLLWQEPILGALADRGQGQAPDHPDVTDLVYGAPCARQRVAGATALGRRLHGIVQRAEPALAIRARRMHLAERIDHAVNGGARVAVSLDTGLLREGAISNALPEGRIDRWIATDTHIDVVPRLSGERFPGVEALVGGADVIESALGGAHADLVLLGGLMAPPSGLVARALGWLRPGGRLLASLFRRRFPGQGLLEAFGRVTVPAMPDLANMALHHDAELCLTSDAFGVFGHVEMRV